MSSNTRWTLDEGINKLRLDDSEEAEITDLGIGARQLTLDVSIAEGLVDGEEGISVTLSIPVGDIPSPDDEQDTRSQPLYWDFSCFMVPAQGETKPELIHRIAKTLGIKPDERVWQDGETIGEDEESE
jgi:hypothetical protein